MVSKSAQSTFDELISGLDASQTKIASALRMMIFAVHPEAVETVRLGDNAATYGVGPRKMIDGYAYIMPLRGSVNLGLYQGALLKDPKNLLEGTGKAMRHVKVRTLKDAASPALKALVAQGLAFRKG